jgi:diguanylate cyclase (GGDEF)-like protein
MAQEQERTFTALPRVDDGVRRHAFLVALSGPQFGEVFPLVRGRPNELGRLEGLEVALRDDGVSRRHARITVDDRGALLEDLGSQNGTWVDGGRVATARLVDGSRLTVGAQTTLKFVHADELEARYQRRMAEGALHDPLTGLHNRRHLQDRLLGELSAAQRHGRPIAVLVADIDHFKRVNDAHGHLVGDEALKLAALALRGALRKEDVLARFGGEEFVVVARETGLAGARVLGERLRRAVENSRSTVGEVELRLTVSVGVAAAERLPPGPGAETDRALLELADRALYLAKEAGRNRVGALALDS